MIWLTGHPGFQRLSRFADGTLRPREQARVASHLADCPRCREEVAMVRRMAETAREIPAPAISDHILRQALNRRAEGERVLLPTADAGAPPARQPKTSRLVAMAAMLTLLVGSLVLSVRVLEADRPALRIHPERPTAGQVLRMEYHGGALFADQTHLKLRARYRTATDRQWQFLAGILVRGDDGLYRAEVALPDSVVYAAFAVEDLEGERLDSNNRQLWDVMVHGDDGRPTLDAMAARVRDLERRDWGEAYEMAREMTRAYPDAPQSWAMRFSFELSLFNRDSVFAEHRTQFRRLEKRLSREAAPAPEEMAWLATYAVGLEDLSSARTWVDRAAESGFGPIVAEAEMLLVSNAFKGDTVGILQDLDSIWDRAPA
ncbi:MAG TPA: zf-HC2 domain-containing protein, partial [Longimicrobiales bacterium]|nr:zf-HC2 domain-containing protein [Longimicrobiales bacterium]